MSLAPQPPARPLIWSEAVEAICAALPAESEAYLVGGAVRDAYLHRPLRDVDLATPGDGQPVARRIADALGGAYYPLDTARGVGRALIPWEGAQLVVDVARFRGPDLLADLRLRDFTLNAMAVCAGGALDQVIDPLGGMADIAARQLRRCSAESIADDPVRALRAVRASITFKLRIEPATLADIKANAARLGAVSAERLRDEFFHLLESANPVVALEVADRLGLLSAIDPELDAIHGVEQGPPHQFGVWRHTLTAVEHLDRLIGLFHPGGVARDAQNFGFGTVTVAFAHLRPQLAEHLAHAWPNGRTHRALLLLAALLHDTGKATTREVGDDGRVHFYRHEHAGAAVAERAAERLRLSNDEAKRLAAIVRHHMRPHWLAAEERLSPRAIYRFWRDAGPAGVDVCLLALADYLATVGTTLDQATWLHYVETQQTLLSRYFLEYRSAIAPEPLLSGRHLMREFKLAPGPQIGEILEELREAQAAGEVSTHEEALNWVQRFLDRYSQN